MRFVSPVERVLIALGPSRNIALLTLDEPVTTAAAMAQVMAWIDGWPRFRLVFRQFGPWYRADVADIDLTNHVLSVDAGHTGIEKLLVTTLTGAFDENIPPWRVILVNPAGSGARGPCRIIIHFDHTIADGVRFANILTAGGGHDRKPADFAAAAMRVRRLGFAEFERLPRDERINRPDVALLSGDIHVDAGPGEARRPGATRRLTRAITRAVAKVAVDRRINGRCAAVSMTGRRQASEANAITAVEVDSRHDEEPASQSRVTALLSRLTRVQWFMVAGQTVLSFFPSILARRLTAGMAAQWDGLLTLVPFGRRPLRVGGCAASDIWCLTVPVLPVPLLLIAAAYRNRFLMTAVTAWRWHGRANEFAEALREELCPADVRPRVLETESD